MVPSAHLFWGSVWAGIAASATTRAQAFIRYAARHNNGQMPPGAVRYTRAFSMLGSLRGRLAAALAQFERIRGDENALAGLEFQSMIALTKVEASDLAAAIVLETMRACGLSGYRNDTEFGIGRLLRDVLSSPIMSSNDRIINNLSTPALMAAVPRSLTA